LVSDIPAGDGNITNLFLECIIEHDDRERKLSTSSTGSIKSKWVKAFKTIKGKGETEK
jgi:hypothetical protein